MTKRLNSLEALSILQEDLACLGKCMACVQKTRRRVQLAKRMLSTIFSNKKEMMDSQGGSFDHGSSIKLTWMKMKDQLMTPRKLQKPAQKVISFIFPSIFVAVV